MRYTDLVKAVQKQVRLQLSYATLDIILRACFAVMAKALERGEVVYVPGFGRFEIDITKSRAIASNLGGQARYQVPERKRVRFVPSATWVDEINGEGG